MDSNQLEQLQQWLESQKAHWQSLLTGHESMAADWQTVLDSCRNLAQQQTGDQAELTESMAQQIKGFSQYGEQLLKSLQNPDPAFDLEQAVDALSKHLHQQANEPFFRHWQLPEAMQRPLQQLLQQMGLSPSDFSSFPFLHQSADNNQRQHRQKLLDASEALTELTQAMQHYSRLQQQINQQTKQQLVAILADPSNQPETLVELHALWIDCYEKSYQQQLSSDEYQQVYGRFCNATLNVQQQLRQYWQQEQRALGLVPYDDYDKLLKSHHQLRKQHTQSQRTIKQLQQTADQQRQASEQQLQALEQRLQQLESRPDLPADQAR